MKWWQKLWEPKPFNEGYLPEKDGHRIYYAEFGNPNGIPVLFFHGGPGDGCRPRKAQEVDLKSSRAILFDQRGCGKSEPVGCIVQNSTEALLEDANRLLNHLNINQKIVLCGSSWGATLALLFAEKYPQKVSKMLLSKIFLADQKAIKWQLEGNRLFYPEFYEEMKRRAEGREELSSFALQQIDASCEAEQLEAMNYFGWWERLIGSLDPQWGKYTVVNESVRGSMRIFFHYAVHHYMLEDGQILKNIGKIKDIQTVILHNRLDFCCPPQGAFELHKAMPNSRLIIVPERGHTGKLLSRMVRKEFHQETKMRLK